MSENNQICVWDLFVRVFHWSLVLLIIVAYVTGDDKGYLHRYVGYAVSGLVAARILWGFVGTQHALFRDFMCSPRLALRYLKGLAKGKPTYYTGHNPAAAWMILFFLIGSLVVCLSGYAAYANKEMKPIPGAATGFSLPGNAFADEDENEEHDGEEEQQGHHAEGDGRGARGDKESDSMWGEIHEISAQCMLLMIFVHIIGVAVASKMHNENLVRAMITGKKAPQIT